MGGRSFKGFKNLSRILSKLPSKCPNHERVGERGCGILGTGKLLRIGRRQQRLVDAEHLGELQRAAFQFAEGSKNFTGIFFLEDIVVRLAGDRLAPVVLEVVYADSGPRTGQCGHAIQAMASNSFLVAQDIFPQAEGTRNRARSNAESIACVRRTSKAKATVFSMKASVRSNWWLSSLIRKDITALKCT